MYGHALKGGNGTRPTNTSPQSDEPATTAVVSSSASPPTDDLSSAFQPACRKPAPSTASVTPTESSIYAVRGLRFCQDSLDPRVSGVSGCSGGDAGAGGASFNRVLARTPACSRIG